MRALPLFAALLVSTTALAGPPGNRGRPPAQPQLAVPADAIPGESDIQAMRQDLAEIRVLARTLRNPRMTAELEARVLRLERDLAGLDQSRWHLIDTAAAFEAEALKCTDRLDRVRDRLRDQRQYYEEQWYPRPVEPVVTTPAELAGILRALEGTSFDKDRLPVLRSAVRDRAFTTDQVKTLLGTFDFSKNQVDAAILLHPQVVDPQNWYSVYEVFTFESDKRRLRQAIGD